MVPCEACGHPMHPINKKRRLCHVCQTQRDVQKLAVRYPAKRGRKCDTCGRDFWPLRDAHRSCPTCVEAPKSHHPYCSLCGERYRPAPGFDGTHRACIVCVTQDSKHHRRYLAALHDVVDERKANPPDRATMLPWPPPEDFTGSAKEWVQKCATMPTDTHLP